MVQFQVLDVSSTGGRFALADAGGNCHVAVSHAEQPTRNTFVNSQGATLGPATLHNHVTGHAIDIVFEAVDCNLGEALSRLHDQRHQPKPFVPSAADF